MIIVSYDISDDKLRTICPDLVIGFNIQCLRLIIVNEF